MLVGLAANTTAKNLLLLLLPNWCYWKSFWSLGNTYQLFPVLKVRVCCLHLRLYINHALLLFHFFLSKIAYYLPWYCSTIRLFDNYSCLLMMSHSWFLLRTKKCNFGQHIIGSRKTESRFPTQQLKINQLTYRSVLSIINWRKMVRRRGNVCRIWAKCQLCMVYNVRKWRQPG